MINKKILRRDIVTYKQFESKDLIRIVITKEKKTYISHDIKGRGIYINIDNLLPAINKGILEKKINKYKGNIEEIRGDLEKLLKK